MEIKTVKKAILSMGASLEEAEAIGICGSLARGDFTERSDIDLFVIVKEKRPETDRIWWERMSDALKDFGRGITVLVYSIRGLEEICNWYVLRLASEGILVYDKGNIRRLFRRIVRAAKGAKTYKAHKLEVIYKFHREISSYFPNKIINEKDN